MIVFLTLLYCGVLFALVKAGVIRMNTWWKISPVAWVALLLIFLFVPMQWGAPSGTVNVYQYVVEVIPNVSGEVTEVPVRPLVPLSKGDELFRIDPEPFEYRVRQLESEFAQARQDVEQLKEAADAARADVVKTERQISVIQSRQLAAAANIVASEAAVEEAEAKFSMTVALVANLTDQLEAAERVVARLKQALEANAISATQLDQAEIKATGLKAELDTATHDVAAKRESVDRRRADLEAARADASTVDAELKMTVEGELPRVQALARDAELAASSMVGGEHTLVATVRAQLDRARYDLAETIVRAPSDGWVMQATLQPGQRVTDMPMRTWMSFVDADRRKFVVGIDQNRLRHVAPGQKAELTLRLHPGRILSATVESIAPLTPEGQIQPSGEVTAAPSPSLASMPYGVILSLDDAEGIDVDSLPGGAIGTAAIFTDSAKATHLIRRVMLRMEGWLNYVRP